MTLKALTLWPEWVYAVHHLGKRVENREWAIPIGRTFALHAGRSIGGRPGKVAEEEGLESVQFMARRAGVQMDFHLRANDIGTSMIYGVFRVLSVDRPGEGALDGWRVPDAFGNNFRYWPLREPISVKGAQGLWTVPDEIEAAIRAQFPTPGRAR